MGRGWSLSTSCPVVSLVMKHKRDLELRLRQTEENDHVTMFILLLPLAVFSFSVKLSSFALASKARISLHYSHQCIHFFQENINANLTFALNAILNLSIIPHCLGRHVPFAASYMVGREDKRTNNRTMLPALKNNAAAGYKGPVKIELLKGADHSIALSFST